MSDSSTSIICRYFDLDKELGEIADDVELVNNKSEKAIRIRDIIGALRLKYSGTKLKKLLYGFANELAEDIDIISDEIYNPLIEDYRKWLEDFNKFANENIKLHTTNGHKVGILEIENSAPVYSIYDNLKSHPEGPLDVLTVMIHKYFRIGKDRNNKFKNKKYTKLEFRTHTDRDLLELAKLFGGSGHKYACGATVMDGVDQEELLRNFEIYFATPQPETANDKKD